MHDLPPTLAAQARPGRWSFGATGRDRLLIVALALLVQLPGLVGWIDSEPWLRLSSLVELQGAHSGWLPGYPGWIDPNVGTTTEALGHLAARLWLSGQVPWWNPYSGIGVPLAAEMQPAALFLPFVLLLRLPHGLLWLRAVMCAVAGLGTYELCRALGLRRVACLVGGLLFAFNGTIAWLPHGPDRASAFLPWILLGIERARVHALGRRRLGWFWVATGLAYSLYAGFPETAYLDGLFAALWAACRLLIPSPGAALPRARVWLVRASLLAKLLAGTGAALLLSAPITWPFLHYLALSDLGLHESGFGHAALVSSAFPMFLTPYVYGPIGALGYAPDGPTWLAWGNIGGYLGAAATILALLGVLGARGRGGVLRWVLAAWVAACLAKTAALPGVTDLLNLLPMMSRTALFRYAEPGWCLAAIVLAAMAVDDWRRIGPRTWPVALAWALAMALLGAALWLAWPTMNALRPNRHYGWFALCVVGWFAAVVTVLAAVFASRATPRRLALVVLVAGLDAVAMFALPLLSSTRGARIDRAPIDFLRAHLGLQRFYSLGAIPPNYGALFGLASINDDMLPVPGNWADHIRGSLDPGAIPATFTGAPGARSAGPDARAMLLARLDSYRALGVRYVIALRGPDSLNADAATGRLDLGAVPDGLPPGQGRSGELVGDFARGQSIAGVGVDIGTYGGASDGALRAELCTASACASGRAELRGAADNAPLDIPLSPPLRTQPGEALHFTLAHEGGTAPVAIWLVPGSLARLTPPAPAGFGPLLTIPDIRAGSPFVRVFRDQHVDIFELPGAAPYFSARPACALAPSGRLDVVATCSIPAVLTRRELSFPGWTATINGVPAPLGSRGIVQTLALPAGRAVVHFAYAPPHIGLAYGAFGLGVLWLVAAWVSERRRGAGWRGAERPL